MALQYSRKLQAQVQTVEAAFLPWLERELQKSGQVRTDALDRGLTDGILARLRQLAELEFGTAETSSAVAAQAAAVGQTARQFLQTQITVLPEEFVRPSRAANAWILRNQRLNRDLTSTYVRGVARVLQEAQQGVRAESLIASIAERARVTASRAKLIAVDQTLTLFGEVNRERQEQLGLKQYEWSSSRDERVRPWHEDLDGDVQDWDNPPQGGGTSESDRGHPTEGINCRCLAVPLLPS